MQALLGNCAALGPMPELVFRDGAQQRVALICIRRLGVRWAHAGVTSQLRPR